MDRIQETLSAVSLLSYFPPGYRFAPREKELVLDYLYPKLSGRPFPSFPVIQFDEFGDKEPWIIWDEFPKTPGEDLFFFTSFPKVSNKRSGTNNVRKINGVGPGRWHGENSSQISVSGNIKAIKKRFKYKNPKYDDHHGEWIMHEYSIPSLSDSAVLCRLRNKEEHEEKDNDDNTKPQARKKRKRNCTDGDDDASVAGSTVTSNQVDCYDCYDPKTPLSRPSDFHQQLTGDNDHLMEANAITKKKTKKDAASAASVDCRANGLELVSVTDNWVSFSHVPVEDFDIEGVAADPITYGSSGVPPIISTVEDTQDQYIVLANDGVEAAATADNASEQECLDMFNYVQFYEDQMASNSITGNNVEEDAGTEDFDFGSFLDDGTDFNPSSFDNLECDGTDFADANCWHSHLQMLLQANATDVY